MTTERPDRGARALEERLGNALGLEGIAIENFASMGAADQWLPDNDMARRLAAAILANGAVFLPDAAELERLRRIEAAARPYMAAWDGMRAEARKLGIWAESDEVIYDSPKAAALRAALEPEGSAQG